jgi:leader peptidase (prepilin peptidase)/N-methyltransferase
VHVAAAALGAGLLYALAVAYRYLRKREGLGFGDVKLAAVAGAWTGPEGLGPSLLLACLAAFAFVAVTHRQDLASLQRSTLIPFGAFLAPSIWLVWFAGESGFDFALSRI